MRRIRILIVAAAACVAALAVVSNAAAGDFADGACSGEPKVCPAATVGQSYSVEFTLKEPGDACPTFKISSGGLPPGLSLASDEGVARGTPTQSGSYTFYVTVGYTCGTGGKGPGIFSDQQFTINVNGAAPRLVVVTPSLPDGNLNQAYAAPGPLGHG